MEGMDRNGTLAFKYGDIKQAKLCHDPPIPFRNTYFKHFKSKINKKKYFWYIKVLVLCHLLF